MKATTVRTLRRAFVISVVAIALFALGAGPIQTSRFVAAAAEHRVFKVGGIECISLSDGYFEGPPQMAAPEIPKGELDVFLASCGQPTETMTTPLNCLFLRIPDPAMNVLIDTGAGPEFPVPTAGKLLLSLKEAGIDPKDIDRVLISHLHQDHVNGAFERSGRAVFPNATLYANREEIDFWKNPETDLDGTLMPPPLKQSVLDDAKMFLGFSTGKLRSFSPGDEVAPGVKAVPLPGHTPGQVGFLIQNRGESLLYVADAESNPFVSLQRPEWRFQNDEDTATAVKTRKDLTDLALKEGWRIFAPHFPDGGVGRLTEESGKVFFVPGVMEVIAMNQDARDIAELYDEFARDPQEATRRHEGKRLEVSGIVTFTGPDIHQTPSIELSDAAGGKRYAVCVVNSFDQLEGISVGDRVRISGNFHIFVEDEWGVVLKQCEVIERTPPSIRVAG